MKFLCVPCDEAMALRETRGPDDGSMTVVFACPACGRETAMLTNAMETQMVRSLGVKIGAGAGAPARPMATVRDRLTHHGEVIPEHAPASGGSSAEAPAEASAEAPAEAGGKCPFTGMVREAYSQAGPRWTASAEARLGRIPSYARPMVRQGIEQYAREQGCAEIDDGVMDAVRGRFGM